MSEPAVGADRPARSPDATPADPTHSSSDPSSLAPTPDPFPDATDRLRALLRQPEPWSERLRDRLAATVPLVSIRSIVVVVVAVGLGTAAFLAVGVGRASSIDPVQVLPRAAPGDAAPATGSVSIEAASTGDPQVAAPPGSAPTRIRVHAAGAVGLPGVHELPFGARVSDLISVAGGLRSDADPDRINLAAPVTDGERVYVPRLGETDVPQVVAGDSGPTATGSSPTAAGSAPTSAPEVKVDLNRADAAALDALPGIGPTTAAAIIGHRDEHGPFTSVDQLQDVTGIGPAKLERLRDLVRV